MVGNGLSGVHCFRFYNCMLWIVSVFVCGFLEFVWCSVAWWILLSSGGLVFGGWVGWAGKYLIALLGLPWILYKESICLYISMSRLLHVLTLILSSSVWNFFGNVE
jgi:hypothetical protein